ncbi:hypothetical protein LHP98_04305 [Rhodobacter sp. Har01]|uniref:hypothetical protein n=1 Tax=Rhodobacter sp. Har01 TaxID=2883999 RepID=UPI001D08C021|nr:hypothetical protein [Rhodobacter sp. Har01]MCB6177350.1 hypothetical protein [Rhodobacter sp. Har01]
MSVVRRHPVLSAAFVLATVLALFFAGQFVVRTIYWMNPEHRNQQLQPWMTVGYIGRSWGLDPRAVDAAAGLPRPDGHPLTLQQIADRRGVPVAEVMATVETAIQGLKAREAAGAPAPP